ncbi:MAG: DUF4861 family protein [Promethearchaeota archaeon]
MNRRKNTIYMFALFLPLFFSVLIAPTIVRAAEGKKSAIITITAGEDGIIADTPIIIEPGVLPEGIENLQTAIVYDGDTALPTQADDLDGDDEIDEIVFQLPEDLDADEEKKFSLYVLDEGDDNGQDPSASIDAEFDEYNASYSDWLPSTYTTGYSNASGNAPLVDEVGNVTWIETDWAVMCVYISSGWRKSAFKHIYMKDEQWDVGMAKWDPWSDWQFQWTRVFWEADNGWHDGNDFKNTSDTVEMLKVGPVRCVLQTKSGIGYKGDFGIQDDLRALRTFTFYSGFPGIHQNIRLTGGDEDEASESMTDLYGGPLQFTTKFLDFSTDTSTSPWSTFPDSNGFNMVYALGTPNEAGNSNRENPDEQFLNLTKMTTTYFGMYSSATKNGYMINFALGENATTFIKDHVTSIDWSDGEIVVKQSYEKFPLEGINRVYVPFSKATNPKTQMDTLNGYWTVDYDMETSKPAPAPGFELVITLVTAAAIAIILRRKRG